MNIKKILKEEIKKILNESNEEIVKVREYLNEKNLSGILDILQTTNDENVQSYIKQHLSSISINFSDFVFSVIKSENPYSNQSYGYLLKSIPNLDKNQQRGLIDFVENFNDLNYYEGHFKEDQGSNYELWNIEKTKNLVFRWQEYNKINYYNILEVLTTGKKEFIKKIIDIQSNQFDNFNEKQAENAVLSAMNEWKEFYGIEI